MDRHNETRARDRIPTWYELHNKYLTRHTKEALKGVVDMYEQLHEAKYQYVIDELHLVLDELTRMTHGKTSTNLP